MAIGTISSPTTWYNGSVVPPTWLQNVQDSVNGITSGTARINSLTVQTGTVQSITAAPDGTVRISSTAGSGTSVPNPAVAAGDLYKYMIPHAMASVTYSGGVPTFQWGHGVSAITDNGVGDLVVTLANAVAATNRTVVSACFDSGGSSRIPGHNWSSTNTIHITSSDAAGAAADTNQMTFTIWAGA